MTHALFASLKSFCQCPPHSNLSNFITWLLSLSLLYFCLLSFDFPGALPPNCTSSASKPCQGGHLFILFILYLGAVVFGTLCTVFVFPPLLGMVLMGTLLRNIPYVNWVSVIDNVWSETLRKMALSVILIKVGFDFDLKVLKRFHYIALLLGFIPCFIEALTVTVICHFLLPLPWSWSFILGFVLSALSTALINPTLLSLDSQGFGSEQGISSLIITAASLDNIMAITGFGIALTLTFSLTNNTILNIFRGPLEVFVGVSYGVLTGVILWFIPTADNDSFHYDRSVLMFLAAFGAIFGCTTFNIPAAGPLAVLTLAVVVSSRWKKENDWKNKNNTLVKATETLWTLLQPLLFGLFGAGFNIKFITPIIFAYGLVIIFVPLIFRMLTTFLVLLGTPFNMKERLFICISWIPKASIQAAIAPLVLTFAMREKSFEQMKINGESILAVSILSTIFTASIGSVLLSITAPKLLRNSYGENAFESTLEFKIPMIESNRPYDNLVTEVQTIASSSM